MSVYCGDDEEEEEEEEKKREEEKEKDEDDEEEEDEEWKVSRPGKGVTHALFNAGGQYRRSM
jgi:hypothetical protein